MKQAGTLGVAGKRVETVVNVWFIATLTAEHNGDKESPSSVDRNERSKLKYIHRVTFLHATATFTCTKHTRCCLGHTGSNVSSRFVQGKMKTLIYVEKLTNPPPPPPPPRTRLQRCTATFCCLLLLSFVRTCKHTRMSTQVGLIQLHTLKANTHTHV